MFSNISSNSLYGNVNENSYHSSNELFYKIQKEIVINNKIKNALNKIWENKTVFEIRSENLNIYSFSKDLNKNSLFLTKENKKVFALDNQYKEDPDKNFEQEENEDDREEAFRFFIEAVLEDMYELYPKIIRISEKVKLLLLICGKKWIKSRENSFENIIEMFFHHKKSNQ